MTSARPVRCSTNYIVRIINKENYLSWEGLVFFILKGEGSYYIEVFYREYMGTDFAESNIMELFMKKNGVCKKD